MIKSKKASAPSVKKSSNDNVSKRERTSISNTDGDISFTNEKEFSSTFRRLCHECSTYVMPDVRIISSDSTVQKTRLYYDKSVSTRVDITEIHPEILAVMDNTIQVITKIIFQHFVVDKNMLIALLKTFQVECYITSLS